MMNKDFAERTMDALYMNIIEKHMRALMMNEINPADESAVIKCVMDLFHELKAVNDSFAFEMKDYAPDYRTMYEQEKAVCHRLQKELDERK